MLLSGDMNFDINFVRQHYMFALITTAEFVWYLLDSKHLRKTTAKTIAIGPNHCDIYFSDSVLIYTTLNTFHKVLVLLLKQFY